jgi:hypothetical protein
MWCLNLILLLHCNIFELKVMTMNIVFWDRMPCSFRAPHWFTLSPFCPPIHASLAFYSTILWSCRFLQNTGKYIYKITTWCPIPEDNFCNFFKWMRFSVHMWNQFQVGILFTCAQSIYQHLQFNSRWLVTPICNLSICECLVHQYYFVYRVKS